VLDPAGTEGFPGTVSTTVSYCLSFDAINEIGKITYTLERNATWNINISAVASAETLIMVSGHHYWNFEAYKESQDLNAHHSMPLDLWLQTARTPLTIL
jgi:aldose 1-epimerase